MKESVLILIKPDGMQKKIVGDIIDFFLASQLKLIGLKTVAVSKALAERHYRHLKGQFFFNQISLLLGNHSHNRFCARHNFI